MNTELYICIKEMDQFYATILSVSTLVISIIWFIKLPQKPGGKTPPGPRGLPILGYLPFLDNNLLRQFTDLAEKYGPIYKLHLGKKLCVVISSPSLVKEVVRDQDAVFASRDAPVAALVASYGGNDIAWAAPNARWSAMRKIFVRDMLSKRSLEASYSLRKDEVRKAIRQVYKEGMPVEIGKLAFCTELNVITNTLWGGIAEGEEGDRVREEFHAVVPRIIDLLAKPNISDFYPALAGFDIQGIKRQMESHRRSVDKVFDAVIAEHKHKLSGGFKNEGMKDFLQILLELKERGEDSEIPMDDIQVKALLMDIISGGTDTTTTTIEWAMAELLNCPKVMATAQKELSDTVGLNNIVEEFHMPKLKYLHAVLKETLRLHPAIPLLVPRSPSQCSTVGGYTVPKNTRVFINVAWIQKDPSVWDSPLEFEPERFLDDNGTWDFSGNNFQYLPFGSGRRICAGIPLAERMLMYLLASFLHSFEWKLPEGEKLDMSETFGIVLRKSIPLVAVPKPRLSDSNLYV